MTVVAILVVVLCVIACFVMMVAPLLPERQNRIDRARCEAERRVDNISRQAQTAILDAAMGYVEPERSPYDNGNVIDAPWWEEQP